MIRISLLVALVPVVVLAGEPIDWPALTQKPHAKLPDRDLGLKPLLRTKDDKPIDTKDGWTKARVELEKAWHERLGAPPKKSAELDVKIEQEEKEDGYTRRLVSFLSADGDRIQAYLLVPADLKKGEKRPAVVVFHQTTNDTLREPVGLGKNPSLALGLHLVKRGYVVLAPQCFIMKDGGVRAQAEAIAKKWPGWTGLGKMTFDASRCVDFLEALDFVDPTRIGCIGHSLGAKETLFALAFEPRFAVGVFNEGGIGLRMSNWTDPWYLTEKMKPHIPAMENHQVLALCAPRPMLILGGDSADGDASWAFVKAALPVYELLGAKDRIGLINHRAKHTFPQEARRQAYRWLDHWLRFTPVKDEVGPLAQSQKPPFHLWLEPEWFEGVKGSFAYWTGPGQSKPTGAWGVAGPGISAEWNQGGESEWNSMGVPAEETKASCQRDIVIPRAGKYKVWVRYYDHRKKTEPFRVSIEQGGKRVLTGELGVEPVVPPNDEFQLFYGFTFGWGSVEGNLTEGSARLVLSIERAGEAWRQVDAVLITDDLKFAPHGREKPAFAYQSSFALWPEDGAAWRGDAKGIQTGAGWQRKPLGGRDFSMWTPIEADPKWWGKQDVAKVSLYDALFQFSPPADIKAQFHKQFAGKKDVPVVSWPGLLPGLYLGTSPDLSPGTPIRQWLERTKTPFYILTNYAGPTYNDKTGPATYAALTGPLADQFLGYIHGEAVGTEGGARLTDKLLAQDRRGHMDAVLKEMKTQQAKGWSSFYKTQVPESHYERSIACLSVDCISLAHGFLENGARTIGYEIDATNAHVPMRIAFERGAARQYGARWINYASGNFGDACNYFTQNPQVPRGAQAWFHSRYAITDGVSASWYRKLYYLNYLGGASAIFWEQGLHNQYILPGPGTHPIQLSPFGRGTEDFMAFVDRLPDRGEPYTPVGILLSHGHSYERVNYRCKMLHVFQEDKNDLELRELFNVLWHPIVPLEGQPAAPDVQSMPSGVYGDIFDVLVDRPAKSQALFNYPVVWAAGDVKLDGAMRKSIDEYLKRGGTLVASVTSAQDLPAELTGFKALGKTNRQESWKAEGGRDQAAVPFEVAEVELKGAKALAFAGEKIPLVTRHAVGGGAVIVVLAPHLMGTDERAYPVLPWLKNGLTQDLLPVDVRLADGKHPSGEIMYQVNKTKDGYLVTLVNNRGIDKTQNGLARVDRRQFTDVVLRPRFAVKSAREWTTPRDLKVQQGAGGAEIAIRVHPGDVQVVGLVEKK